MITTYGVFFRDTWTISYLIKFFKDEESAYAWCRAHNYVVDYDYYIRQYVYRYFVKKIQI